MPFSVIFSAGAFSVGGFSWAALATDVTGGADTTGVLVVLNRWRDRGAPGAAVFDMEALFSWAKVSFVGETLRLGLDGMAYGRDPQYSMEKFFMEFKGSSCWFLRVFSKHSIVTSGKKMSYM